MLCGTDNIPHNTMSECEKYHGILSVLYNIIIDLNIAMVVYVAHNTLNNVHITITLRPKSCTSLDVLNSQLNIKVLRVVNVCFDGFEKNVNNSSFFIYPFCL